MTTPPPPPGTAAPERASTSISRLLLGVTSARPPHQRPRPGTTDAPEWCPGWLISTFLISIGIFCVFQEENVQGTIFIVGGNVVQAVRMIAVWIVEQVGTDVSGLAGRDSNP